MTAFGVSLTLMLHQVPTVQRACHDKLDSSQTDPLDSSMVTQLI